MCSGNRGCSEGIADDFADDEDSESIEAMELRFESMSVVACWRGGSVRSMDLCHTGKDQGERAACVGEASAVWSGEARSRSRERQAWEQ